MTDTTTVPTLTTVDQAHSLLRQLAETHDWVSVFWDRGWGDSGQTAEITIIVDGDGQQPKAHITADVYRALLDQKVIPPNSLKTFKARKLHDFAAPAPEPKTGPTASDIAEQVVTELLDGPLADVPVLAEFYRGLDPDSHTPRVMHEYVASRAYDHGPHVEVRPSAAEVIVGAYVPDYFGGKLVGAVEMAPYPVDSAGEVDLDELGGDGFRDRLVEVVRGKSAEAATAWASR